MEVYSSEYEISLDNVLRIIYPRATITKEIVPSDNPEIITQWKYHLDAEVGGGYLEYYFNTYFKNAHYFDVYSRNNEYKLQEIESKGFTVIKINKKYIQPKIVALELLPNEIIEILLEYVGEFVQEEARRTGWYKGEMLASKRSIIIASQREHLIQKYKIDFVSEFYQGQIYDPILVRKIFAIQISDEILHNAYNKYDYNYGYLYQRSTFVNREGIQSYHIQNLLRILTDVIVSNRNIVDYNTLMNIVKEKLEGIEYKVSSEGLIKNLIKLEEHDLLATLHIPEYVRDTYVHYQGTRDADLRQFIVHSIINGDVSTDGSIEEGIDFYDKLLPALNLKRFFDANIVYFVKDLDKFDLPVVEIEKLIELFYMNLGASVNPEEDRYKTRWVYTKERNSEALIQRFTNFHTKYTPDYISINKFYVGIPAEHRSSMTVGFKKNLRWNIRAFLDVDLVMRAILPRVLNLEFVKADPVIYLFVYISIFYYKYQRWLDELYKAHLIDNKGDKSNINEIYTDYDVFLTNDQWNYIFKMVLEIVNEGYSMKRQDRLTMLESFISIAHSKGVELEVQERDDNYRRYYGELNDVGIILNRYGLMEPLPESDSDSDYDY